jgi:spore maturation protein SpmB
MRIPFVGPSSRVRSQDQSGQVTDNWYLELSEDDAKTPLSLLPTPGLLRKVDISFDNANPSGRIRGLLVAGEKLYAVSGRGVYSLDTGFNPTYLGALTSGAGQVSMAASDLEIIIVDGVNGYIIDIAAGTLTQITDEDYPSGCTVTFYLDSRFYVLGDGSAKIYKSGILDGLSWDGSEFASAEGAPGALIAAIIDHREAWLFKAESGEVWINTGNADFTLERQAGAAIEVGCAAPNALCRMDNSIVWLAASDEGRGIVYRADGYRPQRISTHAIEYAIGQWERLDDAVAYTYQQEGHTFYVLTSPSASETWVYDAATTKWHQRSWYEIPPVPIPPLEIALSPSSSSVSGDINDATITSALIESTVTGGVLPYSFEWTKVSGDDFALGFLATDPDQTFSTSTPAESVTYEGVWRCTVTDNRGTTATADVALSQDWVFSVQYAAWNPADAISGSVVITNGNKTAEILPYVSGPNRQVHSAFQIKGVEPLIRCFEYRLDKVVLSANTVQLGVVRTTSGSDAIWFTRSNTIAAQLRVTGTGAAVGGYSETPVGAEPQVGDIWGFVFDMSNTAPTLQVYLNGTAIGPLHTLAAGWYDVSSATGIWLVFRFNGSSGTGEYTATVRTLPSEMTYFANYGADTGFWRAV